jgi:hypothetical protein
LTDDLYPGLPDLDPGMRGGDAVVPADRLSDGAGLTRVSKSWRNILLMLVILPFWTSFLLRVYAWMGLMGRSRAGSTDC